MRFFNCSFLISHCYQGTSVLNYCGEDTGWRSGKAESIFLRYSGINCVQTEHEDIARTAKICPCDYKTSLLVL